MSKKILSEIPVQKNEEIELTIHGLTHDGLGVGKIKNYTLFVPNTLPTEKAQVKVIKVNKGYGIGKLIELKIKSLERVKPPCKIYDKCGGCQIQHLDYHAALAFKEQLVRDNLERIGKIKDFHLNPIIGMKNPWRYRNKAQTPVGTVNGEMVVGFYQKHSHVIVDMPECIIQKEENDFVIQVIKHLAKKWNIPAYDEEAHNGFLRHIVVKTGHKTKEIMAVLVTNGDETTNFNEFIKEIIKELPILTSLQQNINTKRTNVIFGDKTKLLWGKETITDILSDLKFNISARSFFQVNPEQTEVLYNKALEYANLTGKEVVIDAYAGIGTISLFLARAAKQVYAVEEIPEAINDAEKNAQLNGIENVTFASGRAEEVIYEWQKAGIYADVVVVDPPRKGLDEKFIKAVLEIKPERIVYVSCNPSTLARDLRVLEDGGYKTVEVQPVDMFPQTMHVECVVLMSRVDE